MVEPIANVVISWKSNLAIPTALLTLIETHKRIRFVDLNDECPGHGLESLFLPPKDLYAYSPAVPSPSRVEPSREPRMSFLRRASSRVRQHNILCLRSRSKLAALDTEYAHSTANLQLQIRETFPVMQELILSRFAK